MHKRSSLITSNKLSYVTLLVLASLGGLACGDDEASDGKSNRRERDGGAAGREKAESKGGGGTGGASPIEPLPDQTAGKECSTNEDCATGTCLVMFEGSFGGGTMEAPGGYCSSSCLANTDCGEGGTCSGAFAGAAGRCLKSCKASSECRDGYRCVTALGMAVAPDAGAQDLTGGLFGASGCEPVPATMKLADGVVGAPCTEATDCEPGRCQNGGGTMLYPGGYCTGSCLADSDCGADGSCTLPLGGGAGTCYRSCSADEDCREGYRCRANGNLKQCIPGTPALGEGVAGRACNTDEDCDGAMMSCKTLLGSSIAYGGYCSAACIDDGDCGAGGACLGGFGAALGGIIGATGTCYRACTEAADCRAEYSCGRPPDVFSLSTTQNVCFTTPSPSGDDAGVE